MLEDRFQQFERLPTELSQEIALFTPELRAQLAEFAVEAADRGKTEMYTTRLASLERKRGSSLWSDYLIAHLALEAKQIESWERSLLKVADRLAQSEAWTEAREIGEQIIDSHPSALAARMVLRAVEATRDEARMDSALEQTWHMDKGNPLMALKLARRCEARGETAEALEWLGAALDGLAVADEWSRFDECMLAIVAGNEPGAHEAAIDVMGRLFRTGEGRRAAENIELAAQRWHQPEYVGRLIKVLRGAVERDEGVEHLQAPLIGALRAQNGAHPHFEPLLAISRLAEEGVALPEALKTWDTLWAYRPGIVVEHGSLGLGIVLANDGSRLTIRFPKSPEHSMTLAFAQKSLVSLPENHLKSQLARDREATLGRFNEDPAGVLVDALSDLGGSAKGADVKKYLTHIGFPATSYAAWWKKAKARAADNPRLDNHEAYRDVMHLRKDGELSERRMPVLDPKKGPKAAVTLVNRLLSQHPLLREDAKKRYTSQFIAWVNDNEEDLSERVHVLLLLSRWFPEHNAEWAAVAASLDQAAVDAPNWSSVEDQEAWIRLLATDARWSELLPPFLGSKKHEVRVKAREQLADRWGDRLDVELGKLLERATELASTTVALCTEALNMPELPSWAPAWRVAVSLIAVLENKADEVVSKEALRILDHEEGRLVLLVKDKDPGEDLGVTLERLLRYWRASDRYLFPVFDFIKATPAKPIAEDAERHRSERLRKIEIPSAGSTIETEFTLMTRPTFDKLINELERLNRDLKTSIPASIKKARELGDLRENAEYDAAKLKQRTTTARCEQLAALIRGVRLIEDHPITEDMGGPGTELELDSAEGPRTLWVLGEGDNELGANVVSYKAPVGRALLGRKAGDKVTLPGIAGDMEYTVRSIRKRLPPAPASRVRTLSGD